ncbi:MAG: hypothetical protein KDC87_09330 [Planctomycetes bacterium]|nr:hypothetical protein [Planctomycetota bacterium]
MHKITTVVLLLAAGAAGFAAGQTAEPLGAFTPLRRAVGTALRQSPTGHHVATRTEEIAWLTTAAEQRVRSLRTELEQVATEQRLLAFERDLLGRWNEPNASPRLARIATAERRLAAHGARTRVQLAEVEQLAAQLRQEQGHRSGGGGSESAADPPAWLRKARVALKLAELDRRAR